MRVVFEAVELNDRVVYKPNANCADVGRVAALDPENQTIGVAYPESKKLVWYKAEELIVPWWTGAD